MGKHMTRRDDAPEGKTDSDGCRVKQRNTEPTPILDYGSDAVRRLFESVHSMDNSEIAFLQLAHATITRRILPIYTVKERQPVSKTVERGRGSCSQRLACLEALARRRGIGTRVRALWVSGRFWNSRFPLARTFIPNRVLLAWPQFAIGRDWCGVEEIYGPLEGRAHAVPFGNDGETLFEAIRSTAIDFDGRTRTCSTVCDLSRFVVAHGGMFDSRDDLLSQLGAFEDTWKGRAFELLYAGRRSA
jgi:hypothetical protein